MDVPAKMLTPEELVVCCETMCRGNKALRDAAERHGMGLRDFREKLFNFVPTPEAERNWLDCTVNGIDQEGKDKRDGSPWKLTREDVKSLPQIEAVRKIEYKVLCGFTNLAHDHARQWAIKLRSQTADEEDFFQEAMMALLDAIYGYTDENIAFVTYAWWAIRNRMLKTANQQRPLGAITNEAQKLLKQFEETKQKLASVYSRHVTDEEVFDEMKVSLDDRATILDAKIQVVSGQSISGHGRESSQDYSEFRLNAEKDTNSVSADLEAAEEAEILREAIKYANLTDLEEKVINAYLDASEWGWQSAFARDNVNPHTSQPYSRALIGQVVMNAKRKIKESYLKKAA